MEVNDGCLGGIGKRLQSRTDGEAKISIWLEDMCCSGIKSRGVLVIMIGRLVVVCETMRLE